MSKVKPAAGAPGLRARKRQETSERLTRAAIALFLERGFEATTLDDIASAADISRRSFFHYFDSKEEVVFAWHEEIAMARLKRDNPALQARDQVKYEQLERALADALGRRAGHKAEKLGARLVAM